MAVQVTVKPELLRWARERASLAPAELADRLGWTAPTRIEQWEETGGLTLAHLERLAKETHIPVGTFFLPEPPEEGMPIPDFRTVEGAPPERPSPELLDTLYPAQQRQDWFREYLVGQDADPLPYVNRARISDNPATVAEGIRQAIGFDIDARAEMKTWEEALRTMFAGAEEAGVMVMRNGVVGNNTHRTLDVREFRGFALSDPYAPLVFVNAADAKAAQMFTLAHELAHIWLGESGVSDWRRNPNRTIERFCNEVAAEVLVPRSLFLNEWNRTADPADEAVRLARRFKTSTLVIYIRAREVGFLPDLEFEWLYEAELGRLREKPKSRGGDFYQSQVSRLGRRFARAVVSSALVGDTTYREAFGLLGLNKSETFNELAKSLGVTA